MIIDYLETRNSTQSHGFSLFNNVFVKSNVTLIQKTKKTQTIEKKSLLQVFPSIPSDLIYISRFQLAAEENSTDNFLLVFVFLTEDSDSWATDAENLLLLKVQFKCLLTLQCALVFLLLPPSVQVCVRSQLKASDAAPLGLAGYLPQTYSTCPQPVGKNIMAILFPVWEIPPVQ